MKYSALKSRDDVQRKVPATHITQLSNQDVLLVGEKQKHRQVYLPLILPLSLVVLQAEMQISWLVFLSPL